MEFLVMSERVKERFPEVEIEFGRNLIVPREQLAPFVEFIRDAKVLDMNVLDLLTATDHPSENQIHVVYGFHSHRLKHYLLVKVRLDRAYPSIPSLTRWWGAANWMEREVYDLMGVQFTDHPDLRRILTPPDFVGHGLRKDYERPGFFVKKPDFQ